MKNSKMMMLAVSLMAGGALVSFGCGQSNQPETAQGAARGNAEAQASEQGAATNGITDSIMEHMQQVRGRLQDMGDQSYWMQGDAMLPGAEHMAALSNDLATVAEAMHGAMGQMQHLSRQPEPERGEPSQHVDEMQQHLRIMSHELDSMAEMMPDLKRQQPREQTAEETEGAMTVHGADVGGGIGSMMDHMGMMQGRFETMSSPDHWMRGDAMMPDSQHMANLSNDLATMADAMQGAMGEVRSLTEEPEAEVSAFSPQLELMEHHLQAMSVELDGMDQAMDNMCPGTA